MAAPRALLLPFLLLLMAPQKPDNVQAQEIAINMSFLRADESNSYGVYREGDMAIIVCRARDPINGGPFNVARFEWSQYGPLAMVTIADKNQITFSDGRDRFSGANLTYIEAQNLTDYRIAVSDLDRYDNGGRFFCKFGDIAFKRGLARQMMVRWDPPSVRCSSSVNTTKNVKGEDVSYSCSVTDRDLRSVGQISLWKNDAKLSGLTTVEKINEWSLSFYVDYSTQITDDSAIDVYMCRYTATEGFEDYAADCAFNRPGCVVTDMSDECKISKDGTTTASTTPSRGYAPTMATASMLLVMINWLV